jgi:hypothetical protein
MLIIKELEDKLQEIIEKNILKYGLAKIRMQNLPKSLI